MRSVKKRHRTLPTYVADAIHRHRVGPDGSTAEKKKGQGFEVSCVSVWYATNCRTLSTKQLRVSFEPKMIERRSIGLDRCRWQLVRAS